MDSFLQELSRPRPDPGGGAAAAYGARLGLALLEKVVQLEGQRRPSPAAAESRTWEEALTQVRRLAGTLERFQEEDVRAYFDLTAARTSGSVHQLTAAVQEAVACPRQIAAQSCEGLKLLAWTGERCQKHLVSDLLVGCEFLGAALQGAYHIAGANLPLVPAGDSRRTLAVEMEKTYQEGEDLYRRVRAGLMDRMMVPNCHDI